MKEYSSAYHHNTQTYLGLGPKPIWFHSGVVALIQDHQGGGDFFWDGIGKNVFEDGVSK